jgi:pantothenate kinase-related protein Tda10
MQGDEPNAGGDGTLGRIALKQVRVTRSEVEARNREASNATRKVTSNPMNRLVPYLDLFWRLSDEELSRLARAPTSAVEGLRQQVEEVNRALGRYADLLLRLSDDELARLTGASSKTIRFWRLSQPRHLQGDSRRGAADSPSHREPSSAQSSGSMTRSDDELSETSSSQPFRVATEQSGGEVCEPAHEGGSGTVIVDTEG